MGAFFLLQNKGKYNNLHIMSDDKPSRYDRDSFRAGDERLSRAANASFVKLIDAPKQRMQMSKIVLDRVLLGMRTPLIEQASGKLEKGQDGTPEATLFNGLFATAVNAYRNNGSIGNVISQYIRNEKTLDVRVHVAQEIDQPFIIGLEGDIRPENAYPFDFVIQDKNRGPIWKNTGEPWEGGDQEKGSVASVDYETMTIADFIKLYREGNMQGVFKPGRNMGETATFRAQWKASSDIVTLGFILAAAFQAKDLKLSPRLKFEMRSAVEEHIERSSFQESVVNDLQIVSNHFSQIFDRYAIISEERSSFEGIELDGLFMLESLRKEAGEVLQMGEYHSNQFNPDQELILNQDFVVD